MSKVWRPIGCFNKTEFIFEGYLTKLDFMRNEDSAQGEIFAVHATFGSARHGGTRFSLKQFTQDKSVLVEGAPYIFRVRTRTDKFTEMINPMLVSVEKLERDPVRGVKTRLVGRMNKFYDTEGHLVVVDFECESPTKVGTETYKCRIVPESYALLPEWKQGMWEVDMELRLTPIILRNQTSINNEEMETYSLGEEVDYVWVKKKDSEGKVIMEGKKDGVLGPVLERKEVKNFIPVIWITPVAKVEE